MLERVSCKDASSISRLMSTLHGKYYERLISCVSLGFSNMVIVGKRVEEGLKRGEIQGGSSSQAGVKKPLNMYKRKKKTFLCLTLMYW